MMYKQYEYGIFEKKNSFINCKNISYVINRLNIPNLTQQEKQIVPLIMREVIDNFKTFYLNSYSDNTIIQLKQSINKCRHKILERRNTMSLYERKNNFFKQQKNNKTIYNYDNTLLKRISAISKKRTKRQSHMCTGYY